MPLSTTTLLRFTAKLSRCLSLALLPALASEGRAAVIGGQPQRKHTIRAAQPGTPSSSSITVVKPRSGPVPYLAALAPLPLRFARPGPEPTDEPPAPPEPKPAIVAPAEPSPASDGKLEKLPEEKPAATPSAETSPPPATQPEQPSSEFSEPLSRPPLPILPDDTKRELRAEDVLPFFIYPVAPSTGDTGARVVIPLTSGQPQSDPPAPPSSATYQQK
jgi:hypothetical protein